MCNDNIVQNVVISYASRWLYRFLYDNIPWIFFSFFVLEYNFFYVLIPFRSISCRVYYLIITAF